MDTHSVPTIVHRVLRSPGQPLDLTTRQFMEARFTSSSSRAGQMIADARLVQSHAAINSLHGGLEQEAEGTVSTIMRASAPSPASSGYDFSEVRVHTDAEAAESAREIGALAYTAGNHIAFGAEQYAPGSSAGRGILAHELAHVVQQGRGGLLQPYTIAPSGGRLEQEADRVAGAVIANKPPPVLSSVEAMVQREDGEPAADAGPAPYGPAADAGPVPYPGPAAPGPEAPAPAPAPVVPGPAPAPPVVTDLNVVNQTTAIAYEEPGRGGPHFVTVAGRTGDENVIVEATTDRPLNPGETINWTLAPAGGGTADPGNPLRALVPRRRATHVVVTADSGGAARSLTVWAVFAQVRRVAGPTITFSPPAAPPPGSACGARGSFCVAAPVDFDAEIFPRSLITSPNRPNFVAAPTGLRGNNTCGAPLAAGVDNRFDMSRQASLAVADPAGHTAPLCVFIPRGFPANNAEGNDDAGTTDEKNDPFAAGAILMNGRAVAAGFIGSHDPPSITMPHAQGAVGDTIEVRWNFREFARIDYHSTWWLFSNRASWFATFRLRKNAANLWADDGSTAG